MDDEFLYGLRKTPPREFAVRLKARLDRRTVERLFPPGPRFFRSVMAAVLIGGAAAGAATYVSMHGFFTVPDDDPARSLQDASVVKEAREVPRPSAADDAPLRDGSTAPRKSRASNSVSSAKPSSAPTAAGPGTPRAATSQAGGAPPEPTSVSAGTYLVTWPREGIGITASSDAYPYIRDFSQRLLDDVHIEVQTATDGLRDFCAGLPQGPNLIARFGRMGTDELEPCIANRVGDVLELEIGYDVVVLARSKLYGAFALSPRQLFLALAPEIPDPDDSERLIANPHRTWSDADPGLPYEPIEIIGPDVDSLLGKSFVALAIEAGCKTFPSLAALERADAPRYERICRTVRDDGVYIEMPQGFELIQRLETYPTTIGIFRYASFDANREKLDAAPIGNVEPMLETYDTGSYRGSRTLYLYVKTLDLVAEPRLRALIDRYLAPRPPEFGLPEFGLISPPEAELRKTRAELLELKPPTL